MRTYGRDKDGKWVTVTTDENGFNDSVYLTTLVQNLKLSPQESPFLLITVYRLTVQLFSRYCRLFMLTGSSSSSANIFPLYRLRWRMLIPLFTTFRRLLTQALK